jgi:hypothetical protein
MVNRYLNDLIEGFGGKKRERLLSSALGAAEEFGLVEPRKERSPHTLSDTGKKFLSAPGVDEQKSIILPNFMKYVPYRDIFIRMQNEPSRALKKESITAAWMRIIGGGTERVRQFYTTTFASVGDWSGAIKDTGRTCVLNPSGETILAQILRGEEPKGHTSQASNIERGTKGFSSMEQIQTPFEISNCPHCGKQEIGIENEELINTLSTEGRHLLIIRYTFYCRVCSKTFSRIGQQTVK